MDAILKQLEGIEGAKDLVGKLREKLTLQAGEVDAAKAEATKHAKALKDAEKARDKALDDIEGAKGSTDEQVTKLKAAAEAAVAKLEAAEKTHKAFRVEQLVAAKLDITGEKAAERRAAALKLADLSGVDLDDKGALIGAEAPLKALQETHSYLFAAPAPAAKGNGGPAGGSGQSGRAAGAKPDTREGKIAAWQQKLGHVKDDKGAAA